ncbi:MAG: GAF domain-containing protein [Cyanobacteria bacterium RM1_2_2]|nr:GAF domain-containing protein [Cyanobacteria bacterium RM1_2_2]
MVDLQRVSEIVQSLSGQLEPEVIAQRTTDRLIEKFGCVFARIWLMEPERQFLKLVASSGMYTHTNGFFARVPIGAFKVGKIAQNRIPFLSNRLAEETWVKDRDWAIANQITGFAGYPLIVTDQVIGVLAVFSRHALSNEFLEVLQGLCSTLAVLLENSICSQQQQYTQQSPQRSAVSAQPLSEQLAEILQPARLSLFGTERSLDHTRQFLLTHTAQILKTLRCTYCRLNYGVDSVFLNAMLSLPQPSSQEQQDWTTFAFKELLFSVSCLGGTLQTTSVEQSVDQQVIQVALMLPDTTLDTTPDTASPHLQLRISCQSSILQAAFTHLAYQAGLTVSALSDPRVPLLTDDRRRIPESDFVLWIATTHQAVPKGALGKVDLTMSAGQLRQAVETIAQGKSWGLDNAPSPLSDREQEVLLLLTQGLRDRDVAQQLHISERTVKFHLSNVLSKLKSRTRYQALYRAIQQGWLSDLCSAPFDSQPNTTSNNSSVSTSEHL